MLNEDFMIAEPQVSWPARLPFDFAMGEDANTLLERYDLQPSQLHSLVFTPAFMKEVDKHRQEILDNGVSFRLKAKIQAEEYLQEIDNLINDADTSPAVRLDAIKSVVKWSGYEPTTQNQSQASGGATRLIISWADGSGQVALETNNG